MYSVNDIPSPGLGQFLCQFGNLCLRISQCEAGLIE